MGMTSRGAMAWLVLLVVLAAPSSAWAHIQAGEVGAMVLAEKRPPVWVAVVIVGVFAVFHGHAHGTELPAGQSGLLYSMGFVMATGCLHGVGILIGLIHHWAAGRVFLRVAGATVAVAGILFLYSALT